MADISERKSPIILYVLIGLAAVLCVGMVSSAAKSNRQLKAKEVVDSTLWLEQEDGDGNLLSENVIDQRAQELQESIEMNSSYKVYSVRYRGRTETSEETKAYFADSPEMVGLLSEQTVAPSLTVTTHLSDLNKFKRLESDPYITEVTNPEPFLLIEYQDIVSRHTKIMLVLAVLQLITIAVIVFLLKQQREPWTCQAS